MSWTGQKEEYTEHIALDAGNNSEATPYVFTTCLQFEQLFSNTDCRYQGVLQLVGYHHVLMIIIAVAIILLCELSFPGPIQECD